MIKSITEILNEVTAKPTKAEKVAHLKGYGETRAGRPLRVILALMYDRKRYKFDIPTDPPIKYTPSPYDSQGLIYKDVEKLKYIVNNGGGKRLTPYRKEVIFKEVLERVSKDDAKLLIQMSQQKAIKGLTRPIITEALGIEFLK
jgi:hypothetical protein